MKKTLLFIFTCMAFTCLPKLNFGQAPTLGSTSGFAVFTAAGAFNNAGTTTITGDIGTDVGAFNGFPPGIVIGQIHVADPASAQAASDVDIAYGSLSPVTCGSVISTTLGGGQSLLPNVYCLGAASTINGDLILDGSGDPTSLFIFKIDGALATSINSRIILTNSASLCNVYWQVNGQVDLGNNSLFQGTILANGAINLLDAAVLNGRALSRAGAISLENNTVNLITQPVASIITANGAVTFCAGGSVTLSGNIGGTWSTGSTDASITVSVSGDYSVSTTTGCGTVISNHIIVTVNPLPAAAVGNDVSFCAGGSASIGAAPVTGNSYLWTPSSGLSSATVANPVASPTSTTTYTLTETVTATGCQQTNSVTVTVSQLPVASIITASGNTSFCAGGSVTLSGNNGGTWSTGATTPSITVSNAGDFYVTNTNDCGSVISNHILVSISEQPVASVITANGAISFCAGGSVILSGNSGGTWSNGSTTTSITVTASGDYSVSNTNVCGNAVSNHIIVTVNPGPVASVISANGAVSFCTGGNVTLSGNSGGTWSNGSTAATITVTMSGDYSVVNTNSCGSVVSNHIIVSVNPAPVAAVISANGAITFCAGGNVVLSGNTNGTWSNGATTNAITVTASGDYSVSTTNSCGTVVSNHIIVTVNPLPGAIAGANTSICGGNSVNLGAAPVAGNTYLWTPATGLSSATISNPVASPSATTTYTLTETNTATGCFKQSQVTVTVSQAISCSITGNSSFCQGQSIQLCAPSGYASYLWNTGATTACISVTAAGTYSVTVKNSGGCSSTCSKVVSSNPLPDCSISGNSSFCLGQSTQLCAPAGYASYLWSNAATTKCITVAAAGTYSVTVTNANGCSSTCSKTISSSAAISCSITGNSSICAGQSTQLCAPAGCATYLWSNGATTRCITVSAAGTYSVTVTNASGCSSTCSKTISITAAVSCSITGNNSICAGQSTQLCAPAGCATYLWSNGATTRCITVSAAGTYSLTVTNASGCSSTCSKTVSSSAAISCSITGNSSICAGQSTQLCAPAGCATYLWSNGATTRCITVNAAGTYSLTVTNASGCSSTCSKTISINAAVSCSITGNSSICAGQSTQLCAPAGCATYLWSNGATTRCITVSAAGTYSLTVTNASGCSSTSSKTISSSAAVSCNITGSSSICAGQSTQLCAPVGCATYLWSNGATTRCITVNCAGTYSVTVKNSGGCSSTCSKTVTVLPAPVATITGNLHPTKGHTTSLCAPAGCSSYVWNTGATGRCITVNCAGTYTVTVTNSSGCSASSSACVTYPSSKGTGSVTEQPIAEVIVDVKQGFYAYPNPFSSSATIEFSLPASGHVTIELYNATGNKVATLFNREVTQGQLYKAEVNGRNLPGGIYIYKITAGKTIISKTLILLK